MDRRRSRSRGVTPIGAAVAALVLGAGASGIWWLHSVGAGQDADTASRADAGVIQAAALSFRALHNEGCPTISKLEQEDLLDRDSREDDAWGNRFRVRCDDTQIVVTSAGPDGQPDTADDIRVPR
jgi:general secretion pathway protein G